MVGPSHGLPRGLLSPEMYTPTDTETIRRYISNWAFKMPDEFKAELVPQVKKRIDAAVDGCVKEILDKIKIDPQKTQNTLSIFGKFMFHRSYSSYDPVTIDSVFKNVFLKKYKIIAEFAEQLGGLIDSRSRDILLEGFHGEGSSTPSMHTVTLKWLDSSKLTWPHMGQEPVLTYTPKVHLANEWKACCAGRGTDIIIKVVDSKGDLKEFTAHKAKLQMHAHYFEGAVNPRFQQQDEAAKGPDKSEKSEKSEKSVELRGYSHAAFGHLLQFIYLGELVTDTGTEPKLSYEELLDLYKCANFCGVDGVKEWCVKGFSDLMKDKKIKEEFAQLLQLGLESADDALIQFCFAHFGTVEKMKGVLVNFVDINTIEYLSKTAATYPVVTAILNNCREYKLGLPREAPKSEGVKEVGAAAAAAAGAGGSL